MLVTLIVIGVIVAIVLFVVVGGYNKLVALDQRADQSFADIDVQLKQRQDLIPNLVETVKGYASHERGTLDAVTQARAAAAGATSVNDKVAAENMLTGALGRLFAVAEAYPDLKANTNYLELQRELSDIENKLAAARRFFNNAVSEFNAVRRQFPTDLFAGKVEEANAALAVLTGPAAARDAAFGHLFEPNCVAEARAKLAAGSSGPIDLVARAHPDRMLHLYVAPEGAKRRVWLFDVSAQKSMELQLSQAQKMQAVGQLAGGVAHDFNNLLTAIQLQLSGLLERHPVGDPSYEGLNEIRQTAIRAADLVRKLLAFSRKSTVRRERLDLGELVGEFAVLLRRLLREDVRLETDYGRDLPVVLADKSQLETAVMNLAVNARDAMRGVVEPGDAVVTIRTRRLSRDEARRMGWTHATTGAVALIEVSDTGPGVPQELLDKIFEPFFTTKAVNEGTGMGLATVYGIVEQAGGHINVANLEGAGAAFRIFLPEAAEAELAEVPQVEVKAKAPRDLSGAGRILFVEDEAAVRGIAARLLRQRGYEVIEAEDGEQALELAEEHAGQIDMMISDVIMPGLDGPSLLKKARPFLGDAPVMFISGYAESDFSDLLQDEVGVSFLPKPLDIKTLAERVKQELHAG